MERFLSHLASERHVAASTQNQARSALLFLYKAVLGMELPWLYEITQAKTPKRLPVVLTRDEVARALHQEDLAAGYGEVYLPHALDRKYPNAGRGVDSPLDGLDGLSRAAPAGGLRAEEPQFDYLSPALRHECPVFVHAAGTA